MESAANYCLKDPQDRVIGFRLSVEDLGHEIYDILDWADEHFEDRVVEQTGDHVYICSEAARNNLEKHQITAEPLSIENEDPDDESGGGPGGGGFGGGGGTVETGPTGDSGGGATAEPTGRL
jgi:hypothetical protein